MDDVFKHLVLDKDIRVVHDMSFGRQPPKDSGAEDQIGITNVVSIIH